jgi:hypothetical protein
VFVDVVGFVGGGEDFGFVDVVDAEFLENLGFGKVSDAALGHDRDGDGGHDLADDFGRGHARYAAFGADLRGVTRSPPLKAMDRDCAGLFGAMGGLALFYNGVLTGDVHDDAAF